MWPPPPEGILVRRAGWRGTASALVTQGDVRARSRLAWRRRERTAAPQRRWQQYHLLAQPRRHRKHRAGIGSSSCLVRPENRSGSDHQALDTRRLPYRLNRAGARRRSRCTEVPLAPASRRPAWRHSHQASREVRHECARAAAPPHRCGPLGAWRMSRDSWLLTKPAPRVRPGAGPARAARAPAELPCMSSPRIARAPARCRRCEDRTASDRPGSRSTSPLLPAATLVATGSRATTCVPRPGRRRTGAAALARRIRARRSGNWESHTTRK